MLMKKNPGIKSLSVFWRENKSTFASVPCASQKHTDECQPMNIPTQVKGGTKWDTESKPMVCKHRNTDFLFRLGCEYFGLSQVI